MLRNLGQDAVSDQRVLRLVWQVGNALAKRRNEVLAEYGLTGTQSEVIACLLRHSEHQSVRDVQGELMLSHPTVSGIARRLEAKGLLIRESADDDARRTYLRLTDTGLQVRDAVRAAGAESEAALLRGMSATERAQFEALLQTARDNVALEPGRPATGPGGKP